MKKEKIIVISLIIILIVIMVGVTYAVFSYSKVGERINSITTGAISMEYTESDNIISMNKALPTTDATGKVRLTEGEYFDFTVKGVAGGNSSINYEIGAEEVGEGTIDGSNIKLYLTEIGSDGGETEVMSPKVYSEEVEENTYTGRPSGVMSLTTGTKTGEFTTKYRLRMYVTEEYNPQGDGGGLTFSIRVNVYGKEGEPVGDPVSDIIVDNVGVNGNIDKSDPEQTFITGTDPNNYIWYSGKLWRAISIDPTDNSVKMVTQWPEVIIGRSFAKDWLNDTSVDGFLGNLREPENFIKMDSKWNATATGELTKPDKTTMIEQAVGLISVYEYVMTCNGTSYSKGYLNNSMGMITITPYPGFSDLRVIHDGGIDPPVGNFNVFGVRPTIILKPDVKIVSGTGTESDPYRLSGDNDSNLNGVKLNTRYSGEYISFGTGENNLYRIVSHEISNLTKITSADPLKENNEFKKVQFDSYNSNNELYSTSVKIGSFLNNDYLNLSNGYLTSEQVNMIEDNTTWYLGRIDSDSDTYKLAKYKNDTGDTLVTQITTAKVGMLRYGELLAGQFVEHTNSINYWLITPNEKTNHEVNLISEYGGQSMNGWDPYEFAGVKPTMNLKENVIITSGDGTKNNPFTIKLSS